MLRLAKPLCIIERYIRLNETKCTKFSFYYILYVSVVGAGYSFFFHSYSSPIFLLLFFSNFAVLVWGIFHGDGGYCFCCCCCTYFPNVFNLMNIVINRFKYAYIYHWMSETNSGMHFGSARKISHCKFKSENVSLVEGTILL